MLPVLLKEEKVLYLVTGICKRASVKYKKAQLPMRRKDQREYNRYVQYGRLNLFFPRIEAGDDAEEVDKNRSRRWGIMNWPQEE